MWIHSSFWDAFIILGKIFASWKAFVHDCGNNASQWASEYCHSLIIFCCYKLGIFFFLIIFCRYFDSAAGRNWGIGGPTWKLSYNWGTLLIPIELTHHGLSNSPGNQGQVFWWTMFSFSFSFWLLYPMADDMVWCGYATDNLHIYHIQRHSFYKKGAIIYSILLQLYI